MQSALHRPHPSFSRVLLPFFNFFFFNDPATTEIYTLSLHDALPIWIQNERLPIPPLAERHGHSDDAEYLRSEEHTSELQSRQYLVCRLLLEKKKKGNNNSGDVRKNTTDYKHST